MMDKLYSLYRHTSPSGKVYIGITNQPVTYRWNNGKGYCNVLKGPFKSTILKYGWDSIKHEVLMYNLSEDKAKYLEKVFIKIYKNKGISLNITDGGEGCYGITPWNKGIKVPYEKSNKRKGCHLTEEHKRKLSISHKGKHREGRPWTQAQREKLMRLAVGRKQTEETKRKIRENSSSAKGVLELNECGEILKTFKSASEAGRYFGLDCSWVAKACRNKTICSGHILLYADDVVDISEVKPPHYRAGTSITIENLHTGELKYFDSLIQCATFAGYKSASGLKKCINANRLIKGEWKYVA